MGGRPVLNFVLVEASSLMLTFDRDSKQQDRIEWQNYRKFKVATCFSSSELIISIIIIII